MGAGDQVDTDESPINIDLIEEDDSRGSSKIAGFALSSPTKVCLDGCSSKM